MSNTLTITEHEKIKVEEERNIPQRIISKKDKALLLEVTHKNRLGKTVNVFSSYKETLQAKSIVGSISIKSGLIIEILPKFAQEELEEESKKKHRKILLNMIRVSKERNFISSTTQSSKTSVGEMPLIRYMIELFSESLLMTLRNSTFSNYSKRIENSSYIRGNLLVSKTIQNNMIDKSKVYISYNKHSMDNLLMQIFRTLAKILLNDTNLSYRAKQNLYEVYLLLDNVEIIKIKQHDFSKITFNRLNHNFENLFQQAEFIFNQYMPFTSNINSTPFWAILFNMDYLFEKFCAYLFRRSNIEIEEQSKIDCFTDGVETVRMKPDFLLFENNKKSSVVDAKWKLLRKDKDLYGLNAQNFWQLFSYMNLTDSKEELNGYFIVPKYGNDFEDKIIFKPIKEGGKAIIVLSIDFSLDFEDLIDRYKFEIVGNELKLNLLDTKKEIIKQEKETLLNDIEIKESDIVEKEFQFDFEDFIYELMLLSQLTVKSRAKIKYQKEDEKYKNLFYLKDKQKINKGAFISLRDTNISINEISWHLDNLDIKVIPKNIKYFWRLKTLKLESKNLLLSNVLLELDNLKKLIVNNNIIQKNIEIIKQLKEKGIQVEDNQGNNLLTDIISIEKEEIIEHVEKLPKKTLSITTKNYSTITKEDKQNFIDESDFTLISEDIIELIMQETDIDILEDFTYNQTLPLRFAFAIYNNNLDRNKDEVVRLKENLIKRNIKELKWILEWSIEAQENYIRDNITTINREILLGYSISTSPIFKNIRKNITIFNRKLEELSKKKKETSFEEYYDLALESFKNKDFEYALEYLKEYQVSSSKKEVLENNIYKEIGQPFNKVKEEFLNIKQRFESENRANIKKYIKDLQLEDYPVLNLLTTKLSIQEINQLTFILTYLNSLDAVDNKFIKTINQFLEIITDNLMNVSEEQNNTLNSNVLAWKDLETSLIWEIKNDYNINQVFSWKECFEYAKKLNLDNYANYNDWRVPTIKELKTLHIDNMTNDFYIKKPLSNNITKDIYWSSTEYKVDRKSNAYIIKFKSIKDHENQSYITHSFSIRCVRGK